MKLTRAANFTIALCCAAPLRAGLALPRPPPLRALGAAGLAASSGRLSTVPRAVPRGLLSGKSGREDSDGEEESGEWSWSSCPSCRSADEEEDGKKGRGGKRGGRRPPSLAKLARGRGSRHERRKHSMGRIKKKKSWEGSSWSSSREGSSQSSSWEEPSESSSWKESSQSSSWKDSWEESGQEDQTEQQLLRSFSLYSTEEDVLRYGPIPTFGSKVMGSYDDCDDLRAGLENAAAYVANAFILQNADAELVNYTRYYMPTMAKAPPQRPPTDSDGVSGGGDKLSGFESNVQEAGVDEPDAIKSDGVIICAASGRKVVTLDAETGEELSRIFLPRGRQAHASGLFLYYGDGDEGRWRRLVIIGTGYQQPFSKGQVEVESILSDYGEVRIEVYNLDDPTSPIQLGTAHLNGEYISARAVGPTAHIVTTSRVDTRTHLQDPFNRNNEEYQGLDREEYIDAAVKVSEALLPKFVDEIMAEITSDGNCENVGKIFLFQTVRHRLFRGGFDLWDTVFRRRLRMPPHPDLEVYVEPSYRVWTLSTHIDAFLRVGTFDMMAYYFTDDGDIETHRTAVFRPNQWQRDIYASQDMLLVWAGGKIADEEEQGEDEDEFTVEGTMLRVLRLNEDAPAEVIGVALTRGLIHDQFSLDEQDGYLRVATTTSLRWDGDGNFVPMNSTNQLTVLRLPDEDGDPIEQVGFMGGLGENEEIYAVRFLLDKGYVVTFRRTDPLYACDLSDPSNIPKCGELKVTGFSEYLHPFDPEGNLLISVGEEATEAGVAIGFAISLFDVTDLTNPMLLARHHEGEHSGSETQYDHLSFRTIPGPDGTWAILIVPIHIWDWEDKGRNFHGFKLFNITQTSEEGTWDIRYEFNVSHAESPKSECLESPGWFPSRSLMIEGRLTTFKSKMVKNTDFETGDTLWCLA